VGSKKKKKKAQEHMQRLHTADVCEGGQAEKKEERENAKKAKIESVCVLGERGEGAEIVCGFAESM
jgi:hypothetical protein